MGSSDSRIAFREQFDALVTESVVQPNEGVGQEDDQQGGVSGESLNRGMNFQKGGDHFWKPFLSANLTADDVFELITPEDIRTIKANKPFILSIMLKKIIQQFKETIDEGSSGKISNPQTLVSTRTCLLILTRLLPFLLEEPHDDFVSILFWSRGGYVSSVQREFRRQVSQEKGEVRTIRQGTNESASEEVASTSSLEDEEDKMILGTEILICLQRLLFLNGFCISAPGVILPPNEPLPKHKVDTRFIWKGGIGTAKELPVTINNNLVVNRTLVLRCMLMCLSGSLYRTMDEYARSAPMWLKVLTHGDLPYTANLFCSLMSTVFCYDPIGYGVPYGGVIRGNAIMDDYIRTSLQLLCAVMDFNPSVFLSTGGSLPQGAQGSAAQEGREDHRGSGAIGGAAAPTSGSATGAGARNVFRTMLNGGIKKDCEIELVFKGLVTLLTTIPQSKNTYLPNSTQPITFHQELLILLWHLLTTNPKFLRRITVKHNSNKLLVPILYLLLDSSNSRKHGPAKVGLLHMCCFILLVLSSEREFAVRLNEPFTERFPLEIPMFQGCHADLMVLIIYKVVVSSTSASTNDSLIDMLLTVMCNTSAYIKSFTPETCLKIVSLVDRFTRPSWLFKAPYHYHDVLFLLDMINNLIQYQYEGNQRLVYSILRQKDLFLELPNLKFPEKFLDASPTNISRTSSGEGIDAKESPDPSDVASGQTKGDLANEGESVVAVASVAPRTATTQRHGTVAPSAAGGDEDDADDAGDGVGYDAKASFEAQKPNSGASTDVSSKSPLDTTTINEGGSGNVTAWLPTQAWFEDWKSKLPMQTILRLIHCLLPLVEEECQEKGLTDQSEVMEFLNRTTMVGLLPVPHPIIIRNYQQNAYTALWFTSYMWGVIFSRVQTLALFDWTRIRLIAINNK